MASRSDPSMQEVLALVAPGTPLREGLDRILLGSKGALIIVGDGPDVLSICSGGFLLDTSFTPQRLSELAKMDGAIILDAEATRIARANVHLVPDPSVPTHETGTRHRTAERVSRMLRRPVMAVSENMQIVTAYLADLRHRLERPGDIVHRANQALQTLERYRLRLDQAAESLSSLELEDMATVRDVVELLVHTELVLRIASDIEIDILQLGNQGELVRLQLDELLTGVEDHRRLVIEDYFHEDADWHAEEALGALSSLTTTELLLPVEVAGVLHLPGKGSDLDSAVTARGFRQLSRLRRLPLGVVDNIVDHFGDLPKIMRATITELEKVEGVGTTRALAVKSGLERVTEAAILDRLH